MRLAIKKKDLTKLFGTLSVLFVILTTGSDFFANRHMMVTMFAFLFISVIYFLLKKGTINKKILALAAVLVTVLFIDAFITRANGFATNDAIILLMRLICIVIIASNISIIEFKKTYIKIVYWISIISLACFILLMTGAVDSLPFQQVFHRTGNTDVICTFYYTIGWNGFFGRNAGLFWEPGMFQIILNIAVFFLLTTDELKVDKYIIIFVITILTTMSTTGYICLLLNLVYFLYRSNRIKHKLRYYVIIVLCIIVILILDANTNLITDKLINKGGSFTTRFTDTLVGYALSLDYPVTGYGPFNTAITNILRTNGVSNISNGLAGFLLYNGYPFVIVYLFLTFISLKKICNNEIIPTVIIFIMFILFYNTEFIMPLTLFWMFCFIFLMKKNKNGLAFD